MSKVYSIEDWLSLHCLSTSRCLAVLSEDDFGKEGLGTASDCEITPIRLEVAKSQVLDAFRSFLPEFGQAIEGDLRKIEINTLDVDESQRPITIHGHDGGLPEIRMPYRSTPRDVLNLAHELGHCLQLVTCGADTPPPVMREVAAFLGELALLRHAASDAPNLLQELKREFRRDSEAYFGSAQTNLLTALRTGDAMYIYDWNYPVARHLASFLAEPANRSFVARAFDGSLSLSELTGRFLAEKPHARTENYFPPIPPSEPGSKSGSFHKFLGVATALELDYWQKKSDLTIQDYFDSSLVHFENKTIHFSRDPANRPVGYVTWAIDDIGEVTIENQTAPFGHRRQLLQEVRKRLGKPNNCQSEHPTSANVIQRPW